jgi:hypothetical protein
MITPLELTHNITVYMEFVSLIDGLKKAIQVEFYIVTMRPYLIVLVGKSQKSFSDRRQLDSRYKQGIIYRDDWALDLH